MCVFYLGPLVVFAAHLVALILFRVSHDGRLETMSRRRSLKETLELVSASLLAYAKDYTSLEIFRNLAFAPFSEEVVFRVLMVPSLFAAFVLPSLSLALDEQLGKPGLQYIVDKAAWSGPWAVAWVCPAFFGLAHVHHLVENIRNGVPMKSALLSTLVQFTYTSIFGFIATILLMRTSSVLSPLLSHIFCNFMGLPDPRPYCTPPGKQNSYPQSHLYPYRHILIALNALGLVFFSLLLFPATQSFAAGSLYWPRPLD